ncbi:amino acid adenylation domain-containing protein [Actinoplanes hulinensis]|uniref:Amino acid adenylation domain-containing protein n=1 Tax=Actinoplanes hulinensis TaxID=1144547 RepID=A0ABS7B578_9ACTN|nr:amino acid adenylation domain-containing protein [Actinoplanes hulinensis]MBW6435949.1 amino acid adenylation domain-containing protein [Actinoplanes hulinensis]
MESGSPALHLATVPPAGVGPPLPIPDGASVIDLFEAVAARAPHRPALRHGARTWTFQQLNRYADSVATALAGRGARPGDFAPLVVAEGAEFAVGLLAAMKAGTPFVPIDPRWPRARLAELFRQLSAPVVLSVRATAAVLSGLPAAGNVLEIDGVTVTEDRFDGGRPGPEDLVYGYFTSGSTGTPKCALNRHRGLVNRITAMSHHFGDGAGQIVLQNSKPTFDSSMWQLLWPLTTGGLVILPDRRGILDLEQTCHLLAHHRVTITDFVPSVLGALVDLLELRPELRTELSGLRRMLIGGEEANATVLDRLWTMLPGLRITNTFGPTECSIGSVFHDITSAHGPIPLGTPIPNTAAVVLDDHLRPVPPETVGDIYIGGLCVGAGYLGDPERTARSFLPNPFPQIPGDRIYRTGDLGHHTPDGLLMFDGRRDDQVKIGGVRIELAEVRRTLTTHPSVRAAAVIARGADDSRSLAAFVTLRPGATPPFLLDWLRDRLPPETVPRTLTVVDDIPLTPHGKLDRQALDRLAREAADAAAVEPPATVHEELVASVWREVLGRAEVSVTVPFTDYGGTSLTAHRLSTLLEIREGLPVRLSDLLAAGTVRAQARLFEAGAATPARRVATALLDRDADPAGLIGDDPPKPPALTGRLLLTGATGFIGAHLLAELVTRPGVRLHCLVRARDAAAGAHRLAAALAAYDLTGPLAALGDALADGRIRVVAGDLAAPRLGLGEPAFAELAGDVDAILHAGALVNFLHDYHGHRPANVHGTRELIRLAATGAGCRLHVLSTFSVFPRTVPPAPGALPALETSPDGGYDQSKLVTEHLLARARALGVDSVVYRLGEIWPHRRTGAPNPASLAHSVIYAAARTGVVFPTAARSDHLPVDVLAARLAAAVLGETPPPRDATVHLLRQQGLAFADVFARLAHAGAGPLGYTEFRSRLTALAESDGADDRLVRVAMLLPPPGDDPLTAPPAFDALFTDSSRHVTATGENPAAGGPLPDVAAFLGRLGMTG